MNIFTIILYTSIVLYFQVFILLMILQNLSIKSKIIILEFFSGFFGIKIYFKQKIYKRIVKPKENRPDIPPFNLYNVINHHQVSLLHYKAQVRFASQALTTPYNFTPDYINSLLVRMLFFALNLQIYQI